MDWERRCLWELIVKAEHTTGTQQIVGSVCVPRKPSDEEQMRRCRAILAKRWEQARGEEDRTVLGAASRNQ